MIRLPLTVDGLFRASECSTHEAVTQIPHCRGRTGDLALLARVGSAAHGSEKILGELASLIDGDLAVGAQSAGFRLSPVGVRYESMKVLRPAGVILHMKPGTMVSRIS